MDQTERMKAMKTLQDHIGEAVSVTYIDQFSSKQELSGKLTEVTPYHNIVVTQQYTVEELLEFEEILDIDVSKAKKRMGIPFLGSPDAIMSIVAEDGTVLYDNEHIYSLYNPHFFPHQDEKGVLRIGVNHEAGETYTKKIREMSFGVGVK